MQCSKSINGSKCGFPTCRKKINSLGRQGRAVRCTAGRCSADFCSETCHQKWHANEQSQKDAYREKHKNDIFTCRHHKRYNDTCRCEDCYAMHDFDEGEIMHPVSLPMSEVTDDMIATKGEDKKRNVAWGEGVICRCGSYMSSRKTRDNG